MRFSRLYLFLIILLLCGCSDIDPIIETIDDEEEQVPVTSNEVLERAYQMASVEWMPINPIPRRNESLYETGKQYKGIPYSSVKEINTYLFQDVSYHTFMTAVHNPNSVLYTEDISQAPYHGTNCATYYGAVCSSSIMYALGINIPYSSGQIIDLPSMKALEYQVIDSLRVCDVIWKSGHVQLIYDIEYQEDTLFRITTFETAGLGAHITTYSKTGFMKFWKEQGYVGYRYENLVYSSEPLVLKGFEPIEYNKDLCPSKGDRSVYRTDDTITINIFNHQYDEIVLTKDDGVVLKEAFTGGLHQYHSLPPGIYSVYLQSGDNTSLPVSLEIIETDVSYFPNLLNESIVVIFNSSAKADYVALCTLSGASYFYPISNQDRRDGYAIVPRRTNQEYYCKSSV